MQVTIFDRYLDSFRQDECVEREENSLTVGPNFKYFRLLKTLVITDSRVPNIGTRTLWGLSGLRLLDLRRNRLTTVVDKNFDGLYSLRELYLDHNKINSMVSAAFRHAAQLEVLSIKDNKITGTTEKEEILTYRVSQKLAVRKLWKVFVQSTDPFFLRPHTSHSRFLGLTTLGSPLSYQAHQN